MDTQKHSILVFEGFMNMALLKNKTCIRCVKTLEAVTVNFNLRDIYFEMLQ